MKKCIKNRFFKLTTYAFYLSLLTSIVVFSLPVWAKFDSLIMLEHLILFAPRWWLISLIIILPLCWRFLSVFQRYTLPLLFYISLVYLDFQLPNLFDFREGNSTTVKVVTANMGEGSQLKKLEQVIKYYHPDLILLQEMDLKSVKKLHSNYTYTDCEAGLCLLSKYSFERTVSLNRRILGSWGNFAMSYIVKVNGQQLNLSNVHFETPREVLLDIIKSRKVNYRAMSKVENRSLEAALFGDTIKSKSNLIVAGDFNMPDDDPIYESNFSWLINALNERGFGLNHTQYINWKNVPFLSFRIDHILYSENITANEVQVLESLGGDHRPVMATLEVFH
jgi:vancomycin resistance protein VanJ